MTGEEVVADGPEGHSGSGQGGDDPCAGPTTRAGGQGCHGEEIHSTGRGGEDEINPCYS